MRALFTYFRTMVVSLSKLAFLEFNVHGSPKSEPCSIKVTILSLCRSHCHLPSSHGGILALVTMSTLRFHSSSFSRAILWLRSCCARNISRETRWLGDAAFAKCFRDSLVARRPLLCQLSVLRRMAFGVKLQLAARVVQSWSMEIRFVLRKSKKWCLLDHKAKKHLPSGSFVR